MLLQRKRLLLIAVVLFLYLSLKSRFLYASPPLPHSDEPRYRLFNSPSSLPSTPYAISTFLTGQAEDLNYYTATRVLTYQLLHAPSTQLNSSSTTFLVLCTSTVPYSQKVQLLQDGATVVELDDIPLKWWIKTGVTRWRDQFTKLRVFSMTEYSRILFIDADTLLTASMDSIFRDYKIMNEAPTLFSRKSQIKKDESALPDTWVFAARSDNALTGEREHPIPPLQTNQFSAGFWLAKPDKGIFEYLLSVMGHYRRFDPHTMEQSLLNYAFRREGPMPWRELDWEWSATWPSERDLDHGVKSLHEKFWRSGPERLQRLWEDHRQEMETVLG